MPRTRSLAWSELKIGLLTIVALVLAATLIFALSGSGGFSWQRYSLKTVFTNIAGLNEGAVVRIAGVPVGAVKGISFVGDKVEVTFELSKKMQPRVTTGSRAALGSVSLLGESAVDITPASSGTPIPEWGYVPAGPVAGSIADVTASAQTGIQELTALLQDIRSGKGTIGQFAANPALYHDLDSLLLSVNDITRTLNSGRGSVGRLMTDPAAARSLEASLANLQMITARIQSGEGSLGKFLNDDSFHKELVGTTANFNTLTGRLNAGEGTMGQLMTNKQLFDRFNSTADRMDKLVASLNNGEGTAGQFLHDKQMYENLNKTIQSVNDLVAAIKADPKKYLNIKVSLF
jgi:phospholipid/cholesterol/gamma-HCH transport system substrate-binding protein